MNTLQKKKLTRFDDASKAATGLRIRAAREACRLSQDQLGEAGGVKRTAIANVERGTAYPNREILIFLFVDHEIDTNFILLGHYNRMPGDVQDRLFAALTKLDTDAE